MSSFNPPPPPKTKKHKWPKALKPTGHKISSAERHQANFSHNGTTVRVTTLGAATLRQFTSSPFRFATCMRCMNLYRVCGLAPTRVLSITQENSCYDYLIPSRLESVSNFSTRENSSDLSFPLEVIEGERFVQYLSQVN